MKNLLTLLLLVISLLASGQSDSQSLEAEIKYWKFIAESDDTVAYREYLQRYGEDGLYKDEALTRIALLRTSGKQTQTNSTECCFYTYYYGAKNVEYVVRFDTEHSKVWLKPINYDTARSNLAMSRDFYENQTAVAMSRDLYEKVKKYPIIVKITDNSMKTLPTGYIIATNTRLAFSTETEPNSNGNYYLSIPPGGPYKIKYVTIYEGAYPSKTVVKKSITATLGETKILNAVLDKKSISQVVDEVIPHHKNAWTKDEEYHYDLMKSTSARDVYFKRDNLGTMQGYRYVAFSKDKSSYITWFEQDDNLDGVIREKWEYKLVPKEELLPKSVNYDFLNE